MARKLSDYIDEMSASLANYGGKALECSDCGHAVAIIGYDVKIICEFDITCEECKKEKPIVYPGIPTNPPSEYKPWWQNPIMSGDQPGPGTMTWSGSNPTIYNGAGTEEAGLQGVTGESPRLGTYSNPFPAETNLRTYIQNA